MRWSLAALLILAGCNPGVSPPRNEAAPALNPAAPAPTRAADEAEATPGNEVAPSPQPAAMPGVAGMSPYRRREYERGYRDCMSGNFDRERQGESYRIGCMAAEDARQRQRQR
jgi:hypothetical protein